MRQTKPTNEKFLSREANKILNRHEYNHGIVKLNSLPQYVMVELTQGCNLSCPMCRSERLSIKGRTMSLELFDVIADATFHTAELVDLRGWGESLLLPHIEYCIRRVLESGAKVRFVSNLAMKKIPIDLLTEAQCYVSVSVDTVDDELYSKLRRGGDFSLMKKNLVNLTSAYRKAKVPRDRINITTTVTSPGLARLPDLIEFAEEVGVDEIRLFGVFADNKSELSLFGKEDLVDAALDRMQQKLKNSDVKVVVGSNMGSMPERAKKSATCIHPWSYVLFAHDGGIGFCDHLNGPEGEEYILGSLNDVSFDSIWNGEDWKTLRSEHLGERNKNAANFKECAWCYKNRHVDFEDMFSPTFKKLLLSKGCAPR